MRAHARTTLVLGVLLCISSCGGGPVASEGGLNVLLISLDSTRRDLLGTYGRDPRHAPGVSPSPHLDRLASEGVVMLDAYATSSWTLPSHLSLMTGQPELVHAVDIDYLSMESGHPLLAEVLEQRGYRTAGFYSGPYLEPRFGFARGFDRYEACYGDELERACAEGARARRELADAQARSSPADISAAWQKITQAEHRASEVSHRDVSSRRVTDAALDELDRAARDGRPFFLFAHYFDPHYDYVPPAPHDTRFDPDYSGAIDGRNFFTDPRISVADASRPGGRRRIANERDMEHVDALLEGELSWTDEQIGRILARLDALGLADDTLVVLTADHGDEFFEHGGLGHRRTLYEEVVRAPMVLRLPGRLAPSRVAGLVSNLDVYATVLELLDVPPPAELASTSFLGLIEGRDSAEERSVLGRLVLQSGRTVELFAPGGAYAVPCKQMRVIETFRKGSIKVTRERSWPEADVATAAQALAPLRARERGRELLRWIDLERHPDERAEDHSSDFTDERALAALREFRSTYDELLAWRRGAREAEGSRPAALSGLGYADEGRPAVAPEANMMFRLPPPGRTTLGLDR